MRADALAQRDGGALSGRWTGFGLTHAAKLQRADGSERSRRYAGAAQESATINPATLFGDH
jgi:hypothetical protein